MVLENGFAKVAGSDLKQSFREVAAVAVGMPGFSMAGGPEPGLEHTSQFTPDQSTYANGTHIAEVEVDIETGQVTVLRYLVMHDCGHVINPMVVEGQVVGGVIHAVGNAFFERMVYDDQAQPLSTHVQRISAAGARPTRPMSSVTTWRRRRRSIRSASRAPGESGTIPGDRDAGFGGRERAGAIRRAHRGGADHAGADCGAARRSARRPSPPIG